MRSSTRAKPIRVQLVPMFVTRISAPGTIAAAASQNAAEDGSPGTCRCPPTSSSTGTTVTRRPLRWTAAPRRVSIRSVWSRLALRLGDRRRALGEEPGDEHARLHLRAGDGHVVGDRAQARAADGERREALVGRVDLGAHRAQRRGDAVDGAPADRRVAVEHEAAALLARQPAGEQAHERARVADVDRRDRLARLAQPGAADDDLVRAAVDEGAERLDGGQRGVRVLGVEVAGDADRLGRHRAEQRGAMRDRLVRRRRDGAAQAGGWCDVEVHLHHRKPEFADERRRAVGVVGGAPERHRALRRVPRGSQGHVGDVDPRAPERQARSRRRPPGGSSRRRAARAAARRRPAPPGACAGRARRPPATRAGRRRCAARRARGRAARSPRRAGRPAPRGSRRRCPPTAVGSRRRPASRRGSCRRSRAPRPRARAPRGRRGGSRRRAAGARRRSSAGRGPSGRSPRVARRTPRRACTGAGRASRRSARSA